MVMVVPFCYKCVWGVFVMKMSSCKRSKLVWPQYADNVDLCKGIQWPDPTDLTSSSGARCVCSLYMLWALSLSGNKVLIDNHRCNGC